MSGIPANTTIVGMGFGVAISPGLNAVNVTVRCMNTTLGNLGSGPVTNTSAMVTLVEGGTISYHDFKSAEADQINGFVQLPLTTPLFYTVQNLLCEYSHVLPEQRRTSISADTNAAMRFRASPVVQTAIARASGNGTQYQVCVG